LEHPGSNTAIEPHNVSQASTVDCPASVLKNLQCDDIPRRLLSAIQRSRRIALANVKWPPNSSAELGTLLLVQHLGRFRRVDVVPESEGSTG
jgi:hypothetical protein